MGRPSKAMEEGGPWREERSAVHQPGGGHFCVLTTHKIIPVYMIACESCLNLPPPGMPLPICPCRCGSNVTVSAEPSLIPSLFYSASPEHCNHDWRHMPRTREQFHHGGEKSTTSGRQLASLGLSGYACKVGTAILSRATSPRGRLWDKGLGEALRRWWQ